MFGAFGRIRTRDHFVRSEALCPLSYKGMILVAGTRIERVSKAYETKLEPPPV